MQRRHLKVYLNNNVIRKNDYGNYYHHIESWEFRNINNPKKREKNKAVINELKQVNSTIIDDELQRQVETNWHNNLERFLYEMENNVPGYEGFRKVQLKTVTGIVRMMVSLIARNPNFNYMDLMPQLKNSIYGVLPEDNNLKKDFKKAFWLLDIYRFLFNTESGFYTRMLSYILEKNQIILYKCMEDAGTFITSDNPAFYHSCILEKEDYRSIICPLTPYYLIMITKGMKEAIDQVDFRAANNSLIKKFNRVILSASTEKIVSNRKYLGYIL